MEQEFAEGRAALRASLGLPEDKAIRPGIALQTNSVVNLAINSNDERNRGTMGSPISIASSHSHSGNLVNASNNTILSPGMTT